MTSTYQNYPYRIVWLTGLFSLLVYGIGLYIMLSAGSIFAGIYLVYILTLEFRLLKFHCPSCFYYGKVCAFGKGLISSWFFKKGAPERFTCKTFGFKDLIPDLLVFIIPAVSAIILLIVQFQWLLLMALIVLIILNSYGNAYVRGQLACKRCRQLELGCPAASLFKVSSR